MKEENRIVAAKYFGWWFAWGVFSSILLFIVMKGGGLRLETQIFVIVSFGVLSGLAGLFYRLRAERTDRSRRSR